MNCPTLDKFSVSICVYHNDIPSYFKESLGSVLNQTLRPAQIVLVVDGPITAELHEVIDGFDADCLALSIVFTVVYLKENRGHGVARSVGVQNSMHNLVAIMDADDISKYNRFEKQVSVLSANDFSVVGGQIAEFDQETKKIIGTRNVPSSDVCIKRYLKSRCPFNQVTVMFKKDHVLKVNNYLPFYHNEDYYLWIRMYLQGFKFHNIPEVLVDVRVDRRYYNRRGGLKYFMSESKLQAFMYKKNIISLARLIFNILCRFALQIVIPQWLRGIFFRLLFRD